jgi:hypothetical protein
MEKCISINHSNLYNVSFPHHYLIIQAYKSDYHHTQAAGKDASNLNEKLPSVEP